jgi:hypothetical protein
MGNPRRSRGDARLESTPAPTRPRPDPSSALEENVQAINRRWEEQSCWRGRKAISDVLGT